MKESSQAGSLWYFFPGWPVQRLELFGGLVRPVMNAQAGSLWYPFSLKPFLGGGGLFELPAGEGGEEVGEAGLHL